MSAYVTKPISTCERVSRALSALLSELHFPTRALGPITEARDLLLRAALDANEFYSTERDELTRDVVKLRAELAAAVAERDNLRRCFAKACAKRAAAELRAEQAESQLAAIEAAPTVAVVCSSECFGAFVQQRFFGSELPNIGTDLIARPAKD